MISLKRPALALGAAALMTVSLTACGGGGGSSAPKSASKSDFCDAWKNVETSVSSGGDDEDAYNKFKDAIKKLKDTGTPSDITSDARKGFEVAVDAILKTNWNDVKDKSGDDSFPGVSKDDSAKATAFGTWAAQECGS